MNDTSAVTIGLVTTGQGPRDEYLAFHRNGLRRLGIESRVEIRHALDGLDDAELDALTAQDGLPAVHAHVRTTGPGAETALGPGWREVWIDRSLMFDRIQCCLDDLTVTGIDAAVICIAEEIPAFTLRSQRPVVLPHIAMLAAVETYAQTHGNLRITSFVYGDRQREQQRQTWSRQPWMAGVTIDYVGLDNGWSHAAREAQRFQPHIAMLWGYGLGLTNPADDVVNLAETLGVPLLAPHALAVHSVRHLLSVPVDLRALLA